LPLSKQYIKSAFFIVLNLCATMIVVLPKRALSKAACTIDSLSLSRALVASSNNSIFGFLTKALAIAILYL
jgi:hypothetical protein